MNGNARPNLRGLFNGTTAPDRSSSIADALGPRLIASTPAAERAPDSTSAEFAFEVADAVGPDQAPVAGDPAAASPQSGAIRQRIEQARERGAHAPIEKDRRWTALQWIDPVNAMDRYFEVLQALLDANREFAVGWANAVSSISRRAGIRR